MTNLVPHTMQEWMRNVERRYQDLATRRTASDPRDLIAPRWRSQLSGSVAVATATTTWLPFDVASASAPEHSPAGTSNSFFVYSSSTGQHRYTAQEQGLYFVQVEVQWEANATGVRKLAITTNNAGDADPVASSTVNPGTGTFGAHHEVTAVIPLSTLQFIRVAVYQDSGVSQNVLATSTSTATSGGRAASKLTIIPIGSYRYET